MPWLCKFGVSRGQCGNLEVLGVQEVPIRLLLLLLPAGEVPVDIFVELTGHTAISQPFRWCVMKLRGLTLELVN